MLIKCPECELQVSDKAISCPHCGYPIKTKEPVKVKQSHKKHKKLPNGFGQISKITNRNLYKPYRAMVTVGRQPNGRPLVKPLKPETYFKTYNEAYMALVEYNRNPYDLSDDLTIAELYDKWSESYFKTLKNNSSIRTIRSAWSYCSSIYNINIKHLRARHIKGCMEEGYVVVDGTKKYPTPGVKSRIKSLFNLMLDYAVEYELTDRNYARTFNISNDIIKDQNAVKRGHIPFTDDELSTLWENINTMAYVDVMIVQCYTGWRPQELGLINIKDVDVKNWTFVGGMKTEMGTDRVVPIHTKIRSIVMEKYKEAVDNDYEYLFTCNGSKMTYDKYRSRFLKVCKALKLNPDHKAHDGRMTFITNAKKYNVDEYAIKYIVGHAIEDITEKVYTQREIEWLCTEIEKIR